MPRLKTSPTHLPVEDRGCVAKQLVSQVLAAMQIIEPGHGIRVSIYPANQYAQSGGGGGEYGAMYGNPIPAPLFCIVTDTFHATHL